MYQDKVITCRDCNTEFVFTASEQEFYAEKGFANAPSRCPDCRAARKQQNRGGGNRDGGQRKDMYEVTCAACGVRTQVPFRPSNDRPVYCRDCFSKNNRRY